MSTFTLVVSYIDGSATTRDTYGANFRAEVMRVAMQQTRHSNTEMVTVRGPNEHGVTVTLFDAVGDYVVNEEYDLDFDDTSDLDYWQDAELSQAEIAGSNHDDMMSILSSYE